LSEKTRKKKEKMQGFESTVWQTTWNSFLPTTDGNATPTKKSSASKFSEETNEIQQNSSESLPNPTPSNITIEDLNNIEVLDWSTTWNVVNNVVQQGLDDQKKKNKNGGAKVEQNLYKTELCRSFSEKGVCRYGNKCQFAHGSHEQRSILRHPKYKTEVCKTWRVSGSCRYGNRCRFVHPKEEWHTSWSVPQTSDNAYVQQEQYDQVTEDLSSLNISEM